jgi:hypothetical protein
MALWTDIIDPATLTGYARAALADYEERQGTLARWLPNRFVADIVVRFVAGASGLIDVAKFRAYDAAPEMGRRPTGKRVVLELPALGQDLPITEYEQLRQMGDVEDDQALVTIQNTTNQVVQAVADGIELMRGIVLATGRATIDQDNFQSDDDFGRPASHQLTAIAPWTTDGVSRLEYLQTIVDVYREGNGTETAPGVGTNPGVILMSNRVFRALARGDEFQTQLLNGASRPATEDDVNAIVTGAGLPPIERYDRRVSVNGVVRKVLPDDGLALLPEPVEPDDWQGTDLGATFWGRTLTSTDADYGIERADQPGIVAGAYKNEKPPMGVEVISDAIGLPVLANADRSLWAKVL